MQNRRRWLARAVALGCVVWPAVVGAQRVAPAVRPEPIAAAPTVVDAVRARFPPARGWFRLVADARFDVDADGRLTPDYQTLQHPRVRRSDAAGYAVLPTFAPVFSEAMRVAVVGHPALSVQVTPVAARPARARIEDGVLVYPDAWVDTDVLYKSTPTHVDEYLLLRGPRAPTTWRYRVVLGDGIRTLRQTPGAVEALDPNGAARLRANRPFAVDAEGRRIDGDIRVVGSTLVLSVDLRHAAFPVLVDPDWRPTADMAYGRFYNGAHVLPSGRVLVTGGCSASVCSGDLTIPACRTVVASAETLDPATRTWSRAGDDPVPRFFHASESLADGAVVVAGGCTDPSCDAVTADVRRYDLARGEFVAQGALSEARAGVGSVRLEDGRVLFVGGCTTQGCSTRVELYDPATGTLRRAADLDVARGRATVTLLRDGTVLVAGGCTSITCSGVLASASVYDPAADRWAPTVSPMASARGGHFAARLPDGRVVVGGGCPDAQCTSILATTERYDPATRRFEAGPTMRVPRLGAMAVSLPNGTTMVAQGCQTRTGCDLTNELLNAAGTTFSAMESALTIRAFHQTLLHGPARMVVSLGGCQPRTCSWWNETWDVSAIVPVPDAGPPPDAAVDATVPSDALADVGIVPAQDVPAVVDAGGRLDAGSPDAGPGVGPTPRPRSDCACRAGSDTRSPRGGVAALLAMAAMLVVRRRVRRPS